jgi:hypothetical protein
MRYIALKTGKSSYKFINTDKLKEDAGNVAAVIMIFAIVYLILCL